jgi:hypothetical protein
MSQPFQTQPTGGEFNITKRQPAQLQVIARKVDTYVQPADDPLNTLAASLSTLNRDLVPFFADRKEKADSRDKSRGVMDAAAGKSAAEDATEAYSNGYMALSGQVKGQKDAAELVNLYDTTFDKDGGDIDAFMQQHLAEQTKGMDDPQLLDSYTKAFIPVFSKIRENQHAYLNKKIVGDVEANSMQVMDTMVRGYMAKGEPVPEEDIDNIRKQLNTTMGVSNSRFNDLFFGAVKRIGDEGNYAIYDTFKRKRKDGTPGMYYIPEWKERIDQAQIHAQSVFLAKAKAADAAADDAREDRQEEALYPVFMEKDPVKAAAMYDQLMDQGLFNRASDAIKWRKHLEEAVDGKPSIDQLDEETRILTKIYRGGAKQSEILDGNVTRTQRNYLLGEQRRVLHENRTLAAANAREEGTVYKSMEFRSGEDYIEQVLRPQASPTDVMGVGTKFDIQQRAAAKLEFTTRARTAQPKELPAIRDEIVTRFMKNAREMPKADKGKPNVGVINYTSTRDVVANAHKMTNDDLRRNLEYFKNQSKGNQ